MSDRKIYTKTGDSGTTSLWSGKRISKSHPRLNTYGTIDELNSYLGVTQAALKEVQDINDLKVQLEKIQNILFLLGSYISCDDEKLLKNMPEISQDFVKDLESAIDTMEKDLPALANFILPNGHIASSHLHVSRCICRRAERSFIECKETVSHHAIIEMYLNRLSDYFFVAARWVNYKQNVKDVIWSKDLLKT